MIFFLWMMAGLCACGAAGLGTWVGSHRSQLPDRQQQVVVAVLVVLVFWFAITAMGFGMAADIRR